MRVESKHLVVALFLVVGAGLAYDSVSNYLNPYVPVSQVASQLDAYQGENIQLFGKVEEGSLRRTDEGVLYFNITDGEGRLTVEYRGVPPQNLEEEGSDVVVIGRVGPGGTVESSQVLVKCPSKYEGEDSRGFSHLFLATLALAALGLAYLVYLWFRQR